MALPALVVVLLASGCRKQTDYDELPVPVAAELHEVFHDQQRHLAISFRTIEDYPCGNFQIIYSYQNEAGNLEVDFKGLHVPRICSTIVGPARGELILDDLDRGAYPVNFSYNQQQMQALIHVSQEAYLVETVNSNRDLIIFLDEAIQRVPSNYIWGSLKPLEGAPDQGESFFQQMAAAGAQAPQLEDAHYGFFRISEGGLWLNPYDESLSENRQTFVYAWPLDLSALEEMIADFSGVYDIQVFSAQGPVFTNQEEDDE